MHPGRRSEAIRLLESRGQAALDPDQRYLLALLYLAAGDGKQCEQQVQGLLDRDGVLKNPEHLKLMVESQLNQGHLAEAERGPEELKKQGPRTLQLLGLECRLLKAQKRDAELLALLQAYARDHSEETARLALLLDEFGFSKEAEAAYRHVVAENPQDAQGAQFARQSSGSTEPDPGGPEPLETGPRRLAPDLAAGVGALAASSPSATDAQRGELKSWLLEALKTEPKSRALRLKLAYTQIRDGHLAEAESLYRAILAESPGDVKALNNLAELIAFHDGLRDEALGLVNRAIAAAGNVPSLLDTRAVVQIQLNQPRQAVDDLRTALTARPDAAMFHYHLARAYDQMGNPAEARKSFEQAERLGLGPASVELMERDEYNHLHHRLTNVP